MKYALFYKHNFFSLVSVLLNFLINWASNFRLMLVYSWGHHLTETIFIFSILVYYVWVYFLSYLRDKLFIIIFVFTIVNRTIWVNNGYNTVWKENCHSKWMKLFVVPTFSFLPVKTSSLRFWLTFRYYFARLSLVLLITLL